MVEQLTLITQKFGGSTGVILPSFYTKQLHITPGDKIRISIEKIKVIP